MKPLQPRKHFGEHRERREDSSLITGAGLYTDDLTEPRMVFASLLRSPHAHARVESINTERARQHDDVLEVFTAEDIRASGVPGDLPIGESLPDLEVPEHYLLARDRVRYQGEPVAMVIAADRYTAHDARDAVEVDYDVLPSVIHPRDSVQEDAPRIHDGVPNNVAMEWAVGDRSSVDEQFERADVTVSLELTQNRLIPMAMEPRSALAIYERGSGQLTFKMSTQIPHYHRVLMSKTLGLPEHKVRVIAPEVGGGFGSKDNHYSAEALCGWASMQLNRPVKWTANRTETFVSDVQGRGPVTEAELALTGDGSFLGVRLDTHADLGAYLGASAPVIVTHVFSSVLSGQYEIPEIYCRVVGAFTNTVPVDAYRGAGRPEASYALERLIHQAARELDLDPVELRRQNFIPPDEFPYETAVGSVYDSGNYGEALDRLLEMADYDELRRRQENLRREDRYLGIGLGSFVESSGAAPTYATGEGFRGSMTESSIVRFHPDGSVTAFCGTSGHGQGHETTFAQVIADRLGLDYEEVEIVEGDTGQIPRGTGTFASRSGSVGGSSLVMSADKVIEKARRVAAYQFEAAIPDVDFEDGEFYVRGAPDRSLHIREVARRIYLGRDMPEDLELSLEATSFYDPENFTYPFGSHLAVVEVDPESGEIDLQRYLAVDDCGNQINPMIVEGQIQGGIAQGLGQALYEGVVYDDQGNLTTGSLMDYSIPRAGDMPELELDSTTTPCPHNPLGVKGCGESGTIGAPPAIVNAIVDALEPFGIDDIDMPVTPNKVWEAIREERSPE